MAFKQSSSSSSSSTSVDDLLPDGLFTGERAMTVQNYTEANVKNGLQFFIRKGWGLSDSFSADETKYILFKVGTKKLTAKNRIIKYTNEEFSLTIYSSPTVSDDGTALTVRNYNGSNAETTTVEVYAEPTVTDVGTVIVDEELFFGQDTFFSSTSDSIPESVERIISESTEVLLAFTNNGADGSRLEYFLDWYEGDLDLPLEE